MIESDFPKKVVCPDCRAAIGAKCTEPFFSIGSSTRFVDWFHFSRIEKATGEGYKSICFRTGLPTKICECYLDAEEL